MNFLLFLLKVASCVNVFLLISMWFIERIRFYCLFELLLWSTFWMRFFRRYAIYYFICGRFFFRSWNVFHSNPDQQQEVFSSQFVWIQRKKNLFDPSNIYNVHTKLNLHWCKIEVWVYWKRVNYPIQFPKIVPNTQYKTRKENIIPIQDLITLTEHGK